MHDGNILGGSQPDTVTLQVNNAIRDAFKISLPNINILSSSFSPEPFDILITRENQVMQLIDQKGYIQRKEVELALNISQQTSVLLLRTMVKKGLVKKVGAGKLVKCTRA